jgi:hypothetical protein
MRLSDAGLRQRQTKLIYPHHRLPPWSTEDATRDRSNRLLGADHDVGSIMIYGKADLARTRLARLQRRTRAAAWRRKSGDSG